MTRSYIAAISRDKETGKLEVAFPGLDGCVTFGSSMAQAEERAREALEGWIEAMIDTKQSIPDPVDLETAIRRSARGAVFMRMPAPSAKSRAVPVTISLNERVLERIDAAAEAVGLTRSTFIAHSALAAAGAPAAAEKVKAKGRGRGSRAAA